jgi:hypothetical protein
MIREAIAGGTSQYGMQTFDQSSTIFTWKTDHLDEAKQASNQTNSLRIEESHSTSVPPKTKWKIHQRIRETHK